MKTLIISLGFCMLLAACGSLPTGPNMSSPATSPIPSSEMGLGAVPYAVSMALGGAGSGYLASELSNGDPAMAAFGTSVGLAGGNLLASEMDRRFRRVLAEAYEAGKRAARVEVLEQYWYDQTTAYRPNSTGAGGVTGEYRDIRYEGMVKEGVRYDAFQQQVEVAEPIR